MKIFGQLEKAQLENTTADVGSLPKGMITYRTDLNIAKVSNGTSMLALIDESSTQTLSGKTYATPTFTGAFTMAQATTPANPSSGNNKFYFKADGKLYTLDASGNEAAVGSGAGGGVTNLITNGNADDTAASIFVPYADAAATRPVDGTGGSPTVTTSVTSTSPLNGLKSYLLTKPASNTQGQGWAVPFTVDLAYRAKSLKISADFIINSGTFVAGSNGLSPTDGDLIWYIYDVTNSQLIEPSNIKMFSQDTGIADKFEATFQTSVSGSSYRLIAHCASTSALAYEIKIDNVTVSPQVAVFGTPVTDWQSWTPTGSWVTNTSYVGRYRRVGDSYEYQIKVSTTGAPTATTLSVNLPAGHVIDTAKLVDFGNVQRLPQSAGRIHDAGTNFFEAAVRYATTTAVNLIAFNSGGTSLADSDINATTPMTWATGDDVNVSFSVPIVGLSSSVQMSDSADTRVVAAKAFANSGQSIPNNTSTIIDFGTVSYDSHGAITTGAAWKYRAQTAGFYNIAATVLLNAFTGWAVTEAVQLDVFKNGAYDSLLYYNNNIASGSNINLTFAGTASVYLNVGDYVDIRLVQQSGSAISISTPNYTHVSVTKVNGPSAIAASEKIQFAVTSNSGQSIPASTDTTAICNVKEYDTHNIYNTSTGEFKFPRPGFAKLNVRFLTGNINGAFIYFGQITLYKNGVLYKIVSGRFNPANGFTTYAYGEGGLGFYSLPTYVWTVRLYYSIATAVIDAADQNYITAEMD